jgi:hypothetical protein
MLIFPLLLVQGVTQQMVPEVLPLVEAVKPVAQVERSQVD